MVKKIVAINASPRRGWNTDMLIDKAIDGAEAEGAEVQKFDLYKLDRFTGCVSCFGCKNKAHEGVCIVKDGLKPVLDAIRESDGLIVGAPNYFSDLCAEFKLFYERLLVPYLTYNTNRISCNEHRIPVLLITTCNAPGQLYEGLVDNYKNNFERFIGPTDTLISSETLQVKDYSKYDWNMFDPEQRRERREKVFPLDLEKASEKGAKLVKDEVPDVQF